MADRKLRIAVVTETYPPEINGVAMTISRMVEGLRQNHVVELIRPRQNPQDSAKQEPTLQEVLVRGFPIPRYQGLKLGLPAKHRLIKLWTEKRPDVVHLVTEGPLGSSALSAASQTWHPGQQRFPYQFSQLQPALRLRLAAKDRCRPSAQAAQPHRHHPGPHQ